MYSRTSINTFKQFRLQSAFFGRDAADAGVTPLVGKFWIFNVNLLV